MNVSPEYAKLSEPHESAAALNAAIDAFRDEIDEARKRHRIPDVVVSISASYIDANGKAVGGMTTAMFGDASHHTDLRGAEPSTAQWRYAAMTALVIVSQALYVALLWVLCSPYLCRVMAAGLRAQAAALDAYRETLASEWGAEMDVVAREAGR